MCCCCPDPRRWCCFNPKFLKICVFVAVIALLINLVFSFFGLLTWIQEKEELEESYPMLFRDDTHYHNTDSIIRNMARPNPFMNPYYTRLDSLLDPTTELAVYGPIGEVDERHVRVAVLCGQHAREIITSEICHNLVRLIQMSKAHPLLTDRIATLRSKGVGFWIIPVLNRWGREQIEEDPMRACLRKNQNQVDLNRNFPCPDMVREGSSSEPPSSTTYPGEFDLSEPESKAIDKFLTRVKPDILLNVHSGIDRVLLPYDCCSLAVHSNYKKMVEVAQLAKRQVAQDLKGKLKHTQPSEWYTGSSSQLLYESHGTLMDYASYFHNIPFVYTLEVFQNNTGIDETLPETQMTPEQCMTLFNPEAGKPYEEVNIAWLDFIVSLVEKTLERFDLVVEAE